MSKIITSISDDHLEQCVKALHSRFKTEIKPQWWRDEGMPESFRTNKYADRYDIVAQWSTQVPGNFRIMAITHDGISFNFEHNIMEMSRQPEVFGAFLHDLGMALMKQRERNARDRVPELALPASMAKAPLAAAIEQQMDNALDFYGHNTTPTHLPASDTMH